MKTVGFLTALFWFCVLCGFPHAETPPHPMTPENDRLFMQGLDAVSEQRLGELQGIPQWKRDQMVESVAEALTDLAQARVVIVSMKVIPVGVEGIYCGSALYGVKSHGNFVLNLSHPEASTLKADKALMSRLGCDRRGVVFR